jgi:hypothetical protein
MAFEYRNGARNILRFPLDKDSEDIEVGEAITRTGATAGFVMRADGAADVLVGIAVQPSTPGAADGDAFVEVDVSRESVYEVPPSTGSFVVGDRFKKVDVAASGAAVVRTTSTTGDIEIIDVDTSRNTAKVQINTIFAAV